MFGSWLELGLGFGLRFWAAEGVEKAGTESTMEAPMGGPFSGEMGEDTVANSFKRIVLRSIGNCGRRVPWLGEARFHQSYADLSLGIQQGINRAWEARGLKCASEAEVGGRCDGGRDGVERPARQRGIDRWVFDTQ